MIPLRNGVRQLLLQKSWRPRAPPSLGHAVARHDRCDLQFNLASEIRGIGLCEITIGDRGGKANGAQAAPWKPEPSGAPPRVPAEHQSVFMVRRAARLQIQFRPTTGIRALLRKPMGLLRS